MASRNHEPCESWSHLPRPFCYIMNVCFTKQLASCPELFESYNRPYFKINFSIKLSAKQAAEKTKQKQNNKTDCQSCTNLNKPARKWVSQRPGKLTLLFVVFLVLLLKNAISLRGEHTQCEVFKLTDLFIYFTIIINIQNTFPPLQSKGWKGEKKNLKKCQHL